MSKHNSVLEHLKTGRTITPMEALTLYGSFRLSSIIERLRKRGLNIETEIVGDEKYARYKLCPPDELCGGAR